MHISTPDHEVFTITTTTTTTTITHALTLKPRLDPQVQKEELEDEAMQRLKYASSGPHAGLYHPAYVPYKVRFHQRLLDPRVGDRVEVAWRGKFRLEALDIYQGLAWWVAVVVEKETPAALSLSMLGVSICVAPRL